MIETLLDLKRSFLDFLKGWRLVLDQGVGKGVKNFSHSPVAKNQGFRQNEPNSTVFFYDIYPTQFVGFNKKMYEPLIFRF